ncbi:MAG TPA: RagB/SusD family nutrient uptake outer membrane protein, partial [Gemmatimonadaceae bacterium]
VPFWVDTLATPPAGNPPALQLAQFKLYGTRNAPFPVYVPGEMLLIQAEVKARQGDLPTAIALINQVRAEKGTTYTPGADLGATPLTAATLSSQAAVLAQIAYERKYELFSQGLRWEDLRRLGSYIGVTPKVAFLPMPQAECNTNPNAGC